MNWRSFLKTLNRARAVSPPPPPVAPQPVRQVRQFGNPEAQLRAIELNRRVTLAMSESDAATAAASLPVESEGEKTIEKRIIEGLDRGALVFMAVLEDMSKDADGVYRVDAKTRMEAFKMVSDYLVKRQKAGASDVGDGMPPYEKIRKQLDTMGFMIVPKPKPGRPSKEEIELRKEVLGEEAIEVERTAHKAPSDDDALRARLEELALKRKDVGRDA